MSDEFYIIDGHAYSYQAFYALSGLFSPEGKPTNAIYGFLKMIYKLIEEKQPDYLAVCFDLPSPVFRNEIFESYKANRKPMPEDMREQISILKEVLSLYPIYVLEKEGYEADDLMATLASEAYKMGLDVYLVTPDKDIAQILNEKIKIFDPKKNLVLEAKDFLEKYQIPTENLPDYFALTGDKIDNIPGVNGIGPKKASHLIQEWHSLENLYENLSQIEPPKIRKILEKYKEDAFLSKKLFLIQKNVDIAFELSNCKVCEQNFEKLLPIYKKLGFFSFVSQILEAIPSQKIDHAKKIEKEEELRALVADLSQQKSFSIEIEMEPESAFCKRKISCIALLWDETKMAYIECNNQEKVLEILYPILSEGPGKKSFDLKRLYNILAIQGIFLEPLEFDISLAFHLLENTDKILKIEEIFLQYLGETMPHGIQDKGEYWGHYLHLLRKLEIKLAEMIKEKELEVLLNQVDIPLLCILSEMERLGIFVSSEELKKNISKYQKTLTILEEKIYDLAQENFCIKSTKQLAYILFEKLQLPKTQKTKTGYSVNITCLKELAKYHKLPELILEHKYLEKTLDFYENKISSAIDVKTNRIYPKYRQNSTGKIVSWEIDLEKIEKDSPGIFVCPPQHIFVKAQYSEMELRLLAYLSHSDSLLQAIENKLVSWQGDIVFWIENYAKEYQDVQSFLEESIKKAEQEKYAITLCKRRFSLPEIVCSQKELRKNAQNSLFRILLEGSSWDILKQAMIRIHNKRDENMLAFFHFSSISNALFWEGEEQEKEKIMDMIRREMQEAASIFLPLPVKMFLGKSWQDLDCTETK